MTTRIWLNAETLEMEDGKPKKVKDMTVSIVNGRPFINGPTQSPIDQTYVAPELPSEMVTAVTTFKRLSGNLRKPGRYAHNGATAVLELYSDTTQTFQELSIQAPTLLQVQELYTLICNGKIFPFDDFTAPQIVMPPKDQGQKPAEPKGWRLPSWLKEFRWPSWLKSN